MVMTDAPPDRPAPVVLPRYRGLIYKAARIKNVLDRLKPGEWRDYEQEMTLTVLRCVRTFRPELGYQWSTYCLIALLRQARPAYHRITRKYIYDSQFRRMTGTVCESEAWPDAGFPEAIRLDTGDTADDDREHAAVKCHQFLSASLLTDRDREILTLRYGLDGNEPHTLEQVSEKMGVSRERIRQLQDSALRKLARRFKGE